jgi:4a-hydroxytetrahydrobiopterin dehydratase
MVLGNYLRQWGLIQRDVRLTGHVPSLVKSATPSLADSELAAVLKELPEWEPWEDSLPQEYPLKRQELRRTFAFRDFPEAMEFMSSIAPRFEKAHHHPRWGNEWNIVQIRLTTWDAGNRITHYDVKAARMAEAAYRRFSRRKPKKKTNG